mgnify:FL=1
MSKGARLVGVSVGELASEVALTSRPADADDNSDAESASGDDSDAAATDDDSADAAADDDAE